MGRLKKRPIYVVVLLIDKTFEVIATDSDASESIFHTFEFNAKVSVVAPALQGLDALTNGNVAVADDRAAEIVAAARLEPAFTGRIERAALLVEVLSVCMDSITCKKAYCIAVISVCASKVADIYQCTEIGVINSVDKLFNAFGILCEEAVVFDTGFNALGCGIFGYFTVSSCKNGKNVIEASPSCACCVITGGRIVTKGFAAVCFSNVNKAFNTCDLGIGIEIEEVGADTEAASFDANALTIISDILCIRLVCFKIVVVFGGFNEVNAFCAEFLYLIDTTLDTKGVFFGIAVEAVKTYSYFHYDLYLV